MKKMIRRGFAMSVLSIALTQSLAAPSWATPDWTTEEQFESETWPQLGDIIAPLQGKVRTVGKFRNTHYFIVLESIYLDKPVNTRILGLHGEILARVSTEFKKAVDIEGTGKLRDGRIINFAGRVDGQIRYHVTKHQFGHGVGNCGLLPFHTVAVDGRKIALGSVIEIAETKGIVLPDGSVHDGIWRAEDVGSAIQHDRIDLFVGEGDQAELLKAHGITYLKPLTVRLISPPPAQSCVNDKDAD